MGRKSKIEKELNKITDTVDINLTNKVIEMGNQIEDFKLTKKTLNNIARWALDGKSQFEIAQNLELSKKEWAYLCHVCPAILLVMQHSQAYAEVVLTGTIYQTAIGGHTIKRKMPIKVKDYEDGRVVGEHIEVVEYDEVQPSNPYLLKWLAERKMSEQFGEKTADFSKEHREVIDAMSDEELRIIESLSKQDDNQNI